METIRIKPKTVFYITLVIFVLLFPVITKVNPNNNNVYIKESGSAYSMSALSQAHAAQAASANKKPSRIPRLIHQTVKSKLSIPSDVQRNIDSWKKVNPEWQHILYDDEDIMEFMETYHPESLDVFNSLDSIVEKTDMWRYAVLDTFGGVYADTDTLCIRPVEEWWGDNENATVAIGLEDSTTPFIMKRNKLTELIQFSQWTMASSPGHPIVHNMAYYIYRHMRLEKLGVDNYDDPKLGILHRTGPGIWTDAIYDYIIKNGYDPRDVIQGATIGDVKFLNRNGFTYLEDLPSDLSTLPKDVFVYHLFYGSWKE